jgi:hypothetical protein
LVKTFVKPNKNKSFDQYFVTQPKPKPCGCPQPCACQQQKSIQQKPMVIPVPVKPCGCPVTKPCGCMKQMPLPKKPPCPVCGQVKPCGCQSSGTGLPPNIYKMKGAINSEN